MRVVKPTPLLREGAEILKPIRDDVVVIGALAVQVALDGHDVALSLTRDIDAGTTIESVDRVVAHLEEQGLYRSQVPHEEAFTWVKDDVKVQLIRPFHPFPKGAAKGLPQNNLVPELVSHRWLVAFEEEASRGCFWAARPAALVALKENAFGRTRPDGTPVDRDFSDVALLLDQLGKQIVDEVATAPQMRKRVLRAADTLNTDNEAATAAARELVATGQEESNRTARAMVTRATRNVLRDIRARK